PDINCAWHEIYTRLKAQNRLEDILKMQPVMQWQNQVKRTIVQKGYEQRYYQE
ncbi:MAG: methylenetetrahydrofolate reductase C-terminal domain-containing protein, partial [Desulfobacteraceae bacterium]|nr:methylenetetrahydrofolate reductase C-terminal domain-containing protein [Desulfobacteraceae bacterium]